MARGENPGTVISIKTTLTYDKNIPFGHASAGKDLCLDFDGDLAADGKPILGKFLDLDKNQKATVLLDGEPLIFRKTAAALQKGDLLVGADGTGKVKEAANTVAGVSQARYRVLEVLETGDNGRVKVLRA